MATGGQRRIPLALGVLGLLGMVGGLYATLHPDLTIEQNVLGLYGSLVSALVAFVCGLLVRGRPATLLLVVPSLAFLAIVGLSA